MTTTPQATSPRPTTSTSRETGPALDDDVTDVDVDFEDGTEGTASLVVQVRP